MQSLSIQSTPAHSALLGKLSPTPIAALAPKGVRVPTSFQCQSPFLTLSLLSGVLLVVDYVQRPETSVAVDFGLVHHT